MPVSVTMPALGESVTEGTITRWLKNEGDRVEADEPLVEVSTDKVDTEIPAPSSGVVSQILVPVDGIAEVGAALAIIDDGESPAAPEPARAAEETGAPPEAGTPPEATPAGTPPEATPAGTPPEATPAGTPPEATPVGPPPEATEEPTAEQAAEAVRGAAQQTSAGTEVRLPALGESVTEGTVTRWLKRVGDTVAADEPLLEISTDKVDTEIPSPVAGTVTEIRVDEDGVAEVGAVLAVIGQVPPPAEAAPSAEAPAVGAEPGSGRRPSPRPGPPQPPPPAQPPATGDGRPATGDVGYVTPLVRKLASEHSVDLTTIQGTGVGGRIRKQDVLEAAQAREEAAARAAAPAPAPAEEAPTVPAPAAPAPPVAPAVPSPLRGRTERLSRMRGIIAKRMVESLQVSAQLTTVVEVDVTRIAKLREQAREDFLATHGVKLSFLPFFALATVEALRTHPGMNASLDIAAATVTYHDAEHLGVAVDTERGLVVPVIRDAGDLSLAGLARRIADVAARTRANKVSPDELSGGTFTLTNTGSRGALFDTPIINQPQVGILGTGSVVKRAVVVDDPDLGEIIVPRSMCYLALTYDHRLVDGADAARFLGTLKDRLEAGNFEADLGLA